MHSKRLKNYTLVKDLLKLSLFLMILISLNSVKAQTADLGPNWEQVPGLLGIDAGMSHANHPWIIANDGKAYKWDRTLGNWQVWGQRSDFIRIDASVDGRAVAITRDGDVYAIANQNSKTWLALNINASDVGLGGGVIWLADAVLNDNDDASLLKANFNSIEELIWTRVEGEVTRLDVDANGNVWALDTENKLFFYDSQWQEISDAPWAIDVGVGARGSVYLVEQEQLPALGGGEIQRRNPLNGEWEKIAGRLSVVTAGQDDRVYGVNSLSWALSNSIVPAGTGSYSTVNNSTPENSYLSTLGEILGADFPLPETLVDVPFEELRTVSGVVIGRTQLNGLETKVAMYTPVGSDTPNLAIGHSAFSFIDYIPDIEGTALQEIGNFKNAVFIFSPNTNKELPASALAGNELSKLFANNDIKNYEPYSNLELIAQTDLNDFPDGKDVSKIMQLGSTIVNVEASIDSSIFNNVTYRSTPAIPFYPTNVRTIEKLRDSYGDSLGTGIDIFAQANNLIGKRLGPATISKADWVINISDNPTVAMWLNYSMPIANTSKVLNFKDVYTRFDVRTQSLAFDGELAKDAANTSVEFPNLKLNDLKFSGNFLPPGTVLPEDAEVQNTNFSLVGTGQLSSKARSDRRVRLAIDLELNKDLTQVNPTLLLQTGLSLADITGEEIPLVGNVELTEVLISENLLMGTAQLDGNKMRVARYTGEEVSAPLVMFMHENLDLASYIPEVKETLLGGFTLGNVVFFGRDGGTEPEVFENAEALPEFLKDFLDTEQLGMFPLQVDNGLTAVGYYEPGKSNADVSVTLTAEEQQALDEEKKAFDAMGIPQQGYIAKGHFDIKMIQNAAFTDADDTTPPVPQKSDFDFDLELAVAQFTPPKIGSFVDINGGRFTLAKIANQMETSFVSGMTISLPSKVAERGLKEIAMAGKMVFGGTTEKINIKFAASTALNQDNAAGLTYAGIASFDTLEESEAEASASNPPETKTSQTKPSKWNDALGIPNFALKELALATTFEVDNTSQFSADLKMWSKGTLGSETVNINGDINISKDSGTAPIVLDSANLSIPGPIALSGLPGISELPKVNELAFSELLLSIRDNSNIELSGSMDWEEENTGGKALLTMTKKSDNTYENKLFARLDSFSINKLINDIPGPIGALEMGPTVIGWQNAARETLTISDMGEKLSVLFEDLLEEDAEITMANGLTAIGQVDLTKLPNNISSRDPVTLQLTGLRAVLVDVLKIKEPILLTSAVERDVNQQFKAEVTANIPSFKISEIPDDYIKFVDTKLALTTLETDKLSFDTRANIGLPNLDGSFGNPLLMDGTVSYTFNADNSTDLKVELGLPEEQSQEEVNTPEGVKVVAWNEPLSIPNFKFKDLSLEAKLNRSATAKSLLIKLCGDGEFKELSGAACVEFDPNDLDASNTTIPEFEIDPANAVLSIDREVKLSQLMNTLGNFSNEASSLVGVGSTVPKWPEHVVDATLKKLYLSETTAAFEGDFSINRTLVAGKGTVVSKDNKNAVFIRSQNIKVGELLKNAFPLIKDVTLPESLFIVSTQAMSDFNLDGIPEKMYADLFDGLVPEDEIANLKAISGATMLTKMDKAVYDPLIPDEIESQFKLDGPLTFLFTADDNGTALTNLELSARLPSFAIPQIPDSILRFKETQLKLKGSNSSSISFETTADVTVPAVPIEGLATIPSIAFDMEGLVEYTLNEKNQEIIKVALGLPKKVAQSTQNNLGEGVKVTAWDEPLGIPNFAFYNLGFEAVHTRGNAFEALSLKFCGAGAFKDLEGNGCVDFSPADIQNASIGSTTPSSFQIEPANAVVSIERQIKLSTLVDTLSGAINAGSDLVTAGVTVPKWPANKVEAISNKFYIARNMFALDGELHVAIADDLQTVIQNGQPSEIKNGKSVFDGKIVVAKDVDHLAVFARTDQPFSLSGIVPSALGPLDQLRMPYGVFTFSTQGIDDFSVDELPTSIFKEMFDGLIDNKIGAKLSVRDGVGFLTRVNAEDFPNEVRDVLRTPFGLDKDVVLGGSIGGIFSGSSPSLAMYAKIDKFNLPLPVELPLNLVEIKDADVELFLKTAGPAAGTEIGIQTGAWLNVPRLDDPTKTDRVDTTLGISSTIASASSVANLALSAKVEGKWNNPMGLTPYSLEDTEVKIGVADGAATIEIYSKEATFKDKKFSLDLDSAWVGIVPKQLNIQFAKTTEEDLILEPAIQAELVNSIFQLAMKSSSELAKEIKAVLPVESGGFNPIDIFTSFTGLMGNGADGALDLMRNSPLNMVKLKNPEIYFATPGNSLPPRKNVERPPLGLGLLARGEMILDIGPINQTIANGVYKINLLDGYYLEGNITPPSIFSDSSFSVSASQSLITQTPNGLVLDGKLVIPGLPDIGIPAYVEGEFTFKRPGLLGLGANVDADVSFGGIIQRQGTLQISTDSMSIQSKPSDCFDLPISISGSLSQDNFLNPESYVGLVNVVDLQHIADCLNLDNLLTAALNPSETVDRYMTALDATPLAQVPGYGLARGAVTEVTNVTAAAEGVIKSVPGVGELMAATEKAQKLFAEAPGAKETMAALGEAQKLAGEALEEMKKLPGSEEAFAAASAVVDIAKDIPGKEQAMAAISESMKIAGEAMELAKDVPGAKEAMKAAEEALALAQSMPGLGETMALAGEVMGAMKEVPGAAAAQAVVGEAGKVAGQAAAEATKTAKAVGKAAEGLMNDAVAVAKDPEAAAKEVGKAAEEAVNTVANNATKAANDSVEAISNAISDAGEAAIKAFSSAFNAVGSLFGGNSKNPCNAVWEAMYPHGTNPDEKAVIKMWTTLENFYKSTVKSKNLSRASSSIRGQVSSRQQTLSSLSTDWNNFIRSMGDTNFIKTAEDYHNADKGWNQNSWKFNDYYKDKLRYQGYSYSIWKRTDLADKKATYKRLDEYIKFLKTWQKNRNFDPNVDHPGFRCEKQRSVYMMMEAAASLDINIQGLPGNAINTNTLTRARYDNAFNKIDQKRRDFDKVTQDATNYLKNIRKTGAERDYKFVDDLIKRSTFIAIKSKFRVETSDDIAKKNTSLYLKQEARTNTAIADFTKKAQEFIKQGLPRAKAQAIGLSFTDVIGELRALLKEEEYLTNSVLVSDGNTPTTPVSVNKNITGFVLFNQTPLNTFLTIQDYYTGEVLADTITDEFGEYVFYDLPPNDYLIVKENPTDYIGSSDTYGANDNAIRVSLRDTDSSDNNFYHTKSPTIYGRLVLRNSNSYNPFGAPTASNESTGLFGQTLILQGVGDNSDVRLTTISDWLGNFQFKGFKLGQYQVTKLLDEHDYTPRDGNQYRYQNEPRPINVSAVQDYDIGILYYDRKINDKENAVDDGVRALQLGTIKGHVLGTINNQFTTPEQSGLGEQFVYLSGRTTPSRQSGTPAKNVAAITTTDQSGQYEFKDLEDGTYTVEVIGHKNGSTHFFYNSSDYYSDNLRVSSSANAFMKMWIEENKTDQNRYSNFKNPWRYEGRNNGFGSRQEYNFTRLIDPRRQQRLATNVNVVDRKVSVVSDLKVLVDAFNARFSGRVIGTNNGQHTNPETSGLEKQTIYLSGKDDKRQSVGLTTLTDENGQYSFAELKAGTYTIQRKPDTRIESSTTGNTIPNIRVSSSKTYPVDDMKANIDVSAYKKMLSFNATVSGRFISWPRSRNIQSYTVILKPMTRDAYGRPISNTSSTEYTARPDQQGKYTFENLVPGIYEITINGRYLDPQDNNSRNIQRNGLKVTESKNYDSGYYRIN